jgi:hypothetical protein
MKLFFLTLFFATMSFASEASDLKHTLDKWRKPFHVQNWDITIKPVPIEMLEILHPNGRVLALSSFDPDKKEGIIFVLMRSDYTKETIKNNHIKNVKQDQRDSVVHELVHNIINHMDEENAVVVITKIIKP